MTRNERQAAAEKRRNQLKDMFVGCYFTAKKDRGDRVEAWEKTEKFCNLVIFKEPQNATLIRSALQSAKEYIQSYNLRQNRRPVTGCPPFKRKTCVATSLAGVPNKERER